MASPDEFYISSLVKAAQEGSSDAFCQLFAATYECQYSLACQLLCSDSDMALQAVREAYTAAFYAIGELKDSGTFIPELNKINLQICCSISAPGISESGIENISFRQILALPGNEGPAFVLKYIHGLKSREICSLLNTRHAEFNRCLRSGIKRLECGNFKAPKSVGPAVYKLDPDSAEALLAEILALCNIPGISFSFKDLEAYSSYRKERFSLQKALILVLLIAFFAAPLLFVTPDISIDRVKPETNGKAVYDISVSNIMPVKSVNASTSSGGISLRQTGRGKYQVTTNENGEIKVIATLLNGQYRVVSMDVTVYDGEPPVLLSQRIEDGLVILEFEDSISGIDYDGIYEQETGSKLIKYPEEYGDGYAVFAFPKEKSNVYIPDMAGNTLLVVLNLIK